MNFSKVIEYAASHANPNVKFTYGTAGFRTKGNLLDGVVYRMGCLAALRSLAKGKLSFAITLIFFQLEK